MKGQNSRKVLKSKFRSLFGHFPFIVSKPSLHWHLYDSEEGKQVLLPGLHVSTNLTQSSEPINNELDKLNLNLNLMQLKGT